MNWSPSTNANIHLGTGAGGQLVRDEQRAETHAMADRSESLFQRVRRGVFRSCLRSLPETRAGDRLYSWFRFFRHHKRPPSRAMRYNDVLHRIKTSDDIIDPLRVFVSDKEFLKLYVKAVVGDRYAVPTIDVICSVDAVDAYEFPSQCCIKATHGAGRVVLRKNGEPLDLEQIKGWFDLNYYRVGREANYRLLKPKLIVEPLIFGSASLWDYKIFCVNGEPKLIQVDVDRYVGHKRKYFDAQWNEQDFSIKYPRTEQIIPRPENLAEMLAVAAQLSKAFGFVRVDLYSNDKQVYVGELTHCADNCDGKFMPASAERRVSDYLFGNPSGAAN
jgi:hypothetical protein